MNDKLFEALDALEKTKGISKDAILEALEKALEKSYEKNFKDNNNVQVQVNKTSGEIHVYSIRKVVDKVEDPYTELCLEEAKKMKKSAKVGDEIKVEVKPKNFGRVAAQTARNIIVQNLQQAERKQVYEDYSDKLYEIITGTVQRINRNNIYINLGKTEGVITPKEQIQGERLKAGDRVKLYVANVEDPDKVKSKNSQILLSRSHPNLVIRLFEQEVPEIADGLVEINSIAREAGSRSKISVYSTDPNIDPIGACVGYKGARVNYIVEELHGEKIDIALYDTNPKVFIANALSPARINHVISNVKEKSAVVIVADDQLSLAIGKEGQNVRLAAKLTGWKIDIKGESQYMENPSEYDSLEFTEEDLLKEKNEGPEENDDVEGGI